MGKEFDYINVLSDDSNLALMLKYTNDSPRVPVVVEQEKIITGFDGKT